MISSGPKKIAVAILGSLICASWLNATEPNAPPTNAHQMLILRNGQTLEGKITQNADGYVVDLGYGQIQLKRSEVELVCDSLEDGYRRKRAQISAGNASQHLELAQWCLRSGLLGDAAAELADVAALDPHHPMLDAFQDRLKMAMEPPKKTSPDARATAGPSNEDLDRMVRSLPRGSVEAFTQYVQPVLMNRCASGSCHGAQSDNALRLLRVPSNKLACRRITQRNLYAVLAFVDRDDPAKSRLLTSLVGPHGTVKNGVFSEQQTLQYQRLSGWASLLAKTPTDETIATITPPAASVDRPTPPNVLSQEAQRARPLTASRLSPNVKRGAAALNRPTDPMDPEIFNHRFAPKKKPATPTENQPQASSQGD